MVSDQFKEALANTERVAQVAEELTDSAISAAAQDAGRTPEEQMDRMGDHYAYQATEMDANQTQLDEYPFVAGSVVRGYCPNWHGDSSRRISAQVPHHRPVRPRCPICDEKLFGTEVIEE